MARGIKTTPKNPYNVPAGDIKRMQTLVGRVLDGDRQSAFLLERAISTSDAPLALAQVINATILPAYDAREGIWSKFATKRVASSFRNIRFNDIIGDYNKLQYAGNEADLPAGVLPVVPELAPYPEVGITSSEVAIEQNKRGARFGFSWEAMKEDVIGFLADFPNTLVDLAVDTEDWVATKALLDNITAYSGLVAGTAPDGSAVPANAPLGLDAVTVALGQVAARKIDGRSVRVSRHVLMVAPNLELQANYLRNLVGLKVTDGNNQYEVGNFNPLGNLEVVVNPFVEDGWWALVPAPGGSPRIAVAQVFLAGEEAPELRVAGLQGGYYPGGGQVSWTEGSYDNDSIDFRLRTVGGAGLVTEEGIVWSDGSGS